MQSKINRLNNIAVTLIIIQFISYVGAANVDYKPASRAEAAGAMCGENIFLIIAIILFIKAYRMRKKSTATDYKKQVRMNDPKQREKYLK